MKIGFRSCTIERQWCGISQYVWWTAKVKPRLLFSPCKLCCLRTFAHIICSWNDLFDNRKAIYDNRKAIYSCALTKNDIVHNLPLLCQVYRPGTMYILTVILKNLSKQRTCFIHHRVQLEKHVIRPSQVCVYQLTSIAVLQSSIITLSFANIYFNVGNILSSPTSEDPVINCSCLC